MSPCPRRVSLKYMEALPKIEVWYLVASGQSQLQRWHQLCDWARLEFMLRQDVGDFAADGGGKQAFHGIFEGKHLCGCGGTVSREWQPARLFSDILWAAHILEDILAYWAKRITLSTSSKQCFPENFADERAGYTC